MDQEEKTKLVEILANLLGRLIGLGIGAFFASMGLLAIALPIWLLVKMWQSL